MTWGTEQQAQPTGGFVHLAEAGPGDPGLLTVHAMTLLREAGVVAYDELVSTSILSLVLKQAELIAVGHRHGEGLSPYGVRQLVIERTWAGRHVVRLQGGDPLIFGRMGQEMEALHEAGISFQVVPSVTAAQGAVAPPGMPLKRRGCASRSSS